MSPNNPQSLARGVLRSVLVVGYGQVVLGAVSLGLVFLKIGRGWKLSYFQSALFAPLWPGLYLAVTLHGVSRGPGTPLPLILGLVLNCIIYSALWLAIALAWRWWRRHRKAGGAGVNG